jgi:methionyl-tRNA formyltransferase
MRIVFFGTPLFAKTILEYLLKQDCEIVAVVTRPDKAKGRSSELVFSPVKTFALEHQIPLFQPPKASDPSFVPLLKELNADFFVVAAYAEILKESVLQLPKMGCINVHGSILPKYRGAAPVQRAIIAGETESGVTIMKMAAQLDAGDILAIRKTSIPATMSAGELMEVLANLGKEALWEVLLALTKGTAKAIPQDVSQASYAKKLLPQEGEIDWNRPAESNHNQIRGFTPNPGAWCWVVIKGEKKRLLIKKALPHPSSGIPGEILPSLKTELIIACQTGSLSLLEVQLEGKKQMSAAEFLRGISKEKINFVKSAAFPREG